MVFEFRSLKFNKMMVFGIFVLFNELIMLIVLRVHYTIDIITGIIIAHYSIMVAEKLSFYIDALFIGMVSGKRRQQYFQPCSNCGWSNKSKSHYTMEKIEYNCNFLI
jgi:hypothetical protein